MKIAGLEFPEKCPPKCPHWEDQTQGGICHRCPIFNCVGEFRLLDSEQYRPDWAKLYFDFFARLENHDEDKNKMAT